METATLVAIFLSGLLVSFTGYELDSIFYNVILYLKQQKTLSVNKK